MTRSLLSERTSKMYMLKSGSKPVKIEMGTDQKIKFIKDIIKELSDIDRKSVSLKQTM